MKRVQLHYQKEDRARSPCFLQSVEDELTLNSGYICSTDLDQLCCIGCLYVSNVEL
ncbi:Uncharacterised protein [Vibrio cholerae]|nr:Uncharacterised protein [Vibrio cholerae]CSI19187.1 Uncharacterised protein [Vibrio cholerae]